MILLIRIILIATVIYLIFKSFADFANSQGREDNDRHEPEPGKKKTNKVSKKVGEYVDYEEVE